MHGSDYCYPSTSLDQDLELGGGLGQRIPQGGELLLSFGSTAAGARHSTEQDGVVEKLQAEMLPTHASSHSCASSAPHNCDSHSPLESGLFASVCMSTHQV